LDHYLTKTPSRAASFERLRTTGLVNTVFHPRLSQIVGDWLEQKAG